MSYSDGLVIGYARLSVTHTRRRPRFLALKSTYKDCPENCSVEEKTSGLNPGTHKERTPSTREGFGITFAEAMAADCTVIAADHAESAADKVIGDAGFLVDPTVDSVTEILARAVRGERPPSNPVERAQRYDRDSVADQAETAYQRAVEGCW